MTELPDLPAIRAALHRALGDDTRLRIVDALRHADRSPKELGDLTGCPTNLLAFHLGVLEEVGLIRRAASHGDRRRRYVVLEHATLDLLAMPEPLVAATGRVLFVCTANSARSPFAAHLWQARTGAPALSAGTAPAPRVHPLAVEVAADHGLDLRGVRPIGYDRLPAATDLVISVCDRAHESATGVAAPALHWSIPDPVGGSRRSFARAFDDIAARIDRLARAAAA